MIKVLDEQVGYTYMKMENDVYLATHIPHFRPFTKWLNNEICRDHSVFIVKFNIKIPSIDIILSPNL